MASLDMMVWNCVLLNSAMLNMHAIPSVKLLFAGRGLIFNESVVCVMTQV